MKLLTLADGFGDSVAVPTWYPGFLKWPEIMQLMLRSVSINNLSRYGAGNEYILQCLRKNINNSDVVLIQWAIPNRLDLVLNHKDNFWTKEIANDNVYCDNVVSLDQDHYWLSSGSKLPSVLEYHQKFIGLRQHQIRSQTFIEHATLLLEKYKIPYKFLLTWDSDYLRNSVEDLTNWAWHAPFKGMHSFRIVSKYADLDFNLRQPISLVQFDFIKQFIMPTLDLPWRSDKELNAVENMLYRKYNEAVKNK